MRRRNFLKACAAGAAASQVSPLAGLTKSKLDEAAGLIAAASAESDESAESNEGDAAKVSAAVLHVRQGSFTFRRSFGKAATPDTIFLIASITKPMTAAGVMLLADRGELALSDPLSKFIPEFDEGDRKRITIQHVLTHSSGLPDQLPENIELRKRHAPLSEFVERAIRTPLLFEPGTQVKYQSMGLLLAAAAAERITGQPFPEFLEKEIFRPLGMTRTALGLGRFKISDTALSQVEHAPGLYGGGEDRSDWDWNSAYWRNLAAPWGGAHSTAPDIAKFLEAFLHPDGKVLRPETAASMIVDHNQGLNEPRGLGFAVKPGAFGRACSAKTFGHGGSTGTLAWADPETNMTCVTLTTLPARLSNELVLHPVSDLVSESAV